MTWPAGAGTVAGRPAAPAGDVVRAHADQLARPRTAEHTP